MDIIVNGEARTVEEPLSISALLKLYAIEGRMVVIERNGEIVARSQFDAVTVQDGDVLEVVQMMAGG
jgi:thiamine biosynthesis protein ThiS